MQEEAIQEEPTVDASEHDHGPTWQAELIRFLVLIGIFLVVIVVIAWSRPLIFDTILPAVLGMSGTTAVAEPVPDDSMGTGGIEHVVQAGEDLFQIAQRYGVTAGAILAANDIADGSSLEPGSVLYIPPKP